MNSPLLRSLAMAHKLRILNVRQIYRVVSRPNEARKSLFRETEGHRIHRAKEPVFEAAVSALYPEPLSSVPNADLESDLLQFIEDAVRYKKDSEGVPNKVMFREYACPQLLHDALKKTFPELLPAMIRNMRILEFSYDTYDDKAQGRADCLHAYSRLVSLYESTNTNAYYSGSIAPFDTESRKLGIMYKEPVAYVVEEEAPTQKNVRFMKPFSHMVKENANRLHVKITTDEDCLRIISDPSEPSIGLLYSNVGSMKDSLLNHAISLASKRRVPLKK